MGDRPISTVHFGGGTPGYLGIANLSQIVACCRKFFNITPETEWALETTVESLTPDLLQSLHRLGFRRLHLGVQTMQDEVRAAIGRKRPAAEVLTKAEAARALGWVVSVDLICGLPGETLDGFMAGIQALAAIGVDGFSLYELLIRTQNRRWAEAHRLVERSHLPNYWMFLAGAYWLEAQGFGKNLFNHWATPRDQNIYFTFPTRGEDLLALGTIADGVFGDLQYRHPRYAEYTQTATEAFPGLAGGLRRNPAELRLKPYLTALLAGHAAAWFGDTAGVAVHRWEEHGLIRRTADGGFSITPSGAWFTGNLINEIAACQ